MDTLIVATIQQQMQIASSHDEYREDLRRFMKVATAKQARLVVFPELGGLVVMPPFLGDPRATLIKRAEYGRRKRAGLWDRLTGQAADLLARWFKADLRPALAALLDVAAQDVWASYCETFAGLAREFSVTLVAPSGYFPDPNDGVTRNLAAVFDEHGALLGTQAKVVLHPEDTDLAQPGNTWDVIPTAAGRLGLILGSDVLFPEVGRLLAYQSADVLVSQAACMEPLLFNKIRTGILARMQDNQLFAAASFLVGPNRMSRGQRMPYAGKSAIFAPQELTPRKTGVLVEMTSRQSEGVLTAVWDFAALRELWESSDTPVRRQLPLDQAGQVLGQIYSRLEHLPRLLAPDDLLEQKDLLDVEVVQETGESRAASEQLAVDADAPRLLTLDELEVRSSITSRWQVDSTTASPAPDVATQDAAKEGDAAETPDAERVEPSSVDDWPREELVDNEDAEPDASGFSGEDETDEMDALPRRPDSSSSKKAD